MIHSAAERLSLGSLLIEPALCGETILSEGDFTDATMQRIFRVLRRLSSSSEAFDIALIIDHFREEEPALVETVKDLVSETTSTVSFRAYEKAVRSATISRQISEAARTISEIAQTRVTAAEKLDEAQRLVNSIRLDQTSDRRSNTTTIRSLIQQLEDLAAGKSVGVPTGFASIDRRLRGLRAGDLVIVAGRPAMGKTTYALNIALRAATQSDSQVLVFSMEMSAEQVMSKLISAHGGIEFDTMMDGSASNNPEFYRAAAVVEKSGIIIDDTPALSVHQLSSRARRTKGLGLIVVDYIGLMSGEADSRVENMTRISGGLKSLARELRIPILALAQLNRGVEMREDKRPHLSDLRDSGSVEQDADIVQMLYRPDYYDPFCAERGTAEVITRKFRLGETGSDVLKFSGAMSRFENLEEAF